MVLECGCEGVSMFILFPVKSWARKGKCKGHGREERVCWFAGRALKRERGGGKSIKSTWLRAINLTPRHVQACSLRFRVRSEDV